MPGLVPAKKRPGPFPTDRRAVPATPPLAVRIAALERDLADLRQQQRDADDARVLRAIVNAYGVCFTVHAITRRAARDAALRAALAGLGPRQLAKRLVRVGSRSVDGLSVRRVKLSDVGWFWEIQIHDDAGGGA